MDDRRAGEVNMPVAETEILPKLLKPDAAPDPVGVDGVDNHRDEEAVDKERRELPAFSHRPSRDGGRRIHEDHLKEEEGEDRRVVVDALQEKSLRSKEAEVLSEEVEDEFAIEAGGPAREGRSADASHLQTET